MEGLKRALERLLEEYGAILLHLFFYFKPHLWAALAWLLVKLHLMGVFLAVAAWIGAAFHGSASCCLVTMIISIVVFVLMICCLLSAAFVWWVWQQQSLTPFPYLT